MSKFLTHRVFKECTLQFSKNFALPKNGGYFEFLPKMAKHEFASISLTVRDRAISSQFLTHRVSENSTLGNLKKIFPSPKMAAILNFRIFAKNVKTRIHEFASISLTVRDRVISSIFDPQGI